MDLQETSFGNVLETQSKLETQFPKMFTHNYGGLEVNAGWLQLIESLCTRIQSHIDWKSKSGNEIEQVTIDQIKEKFGTLRFYYSGGDEYISGLVDMAEEMSGHICDVCGSPGKLGGKRWIATRCKNHE